MKGKSILSRLQIIPEETTNETLNETTTSLEIIPNTTITSTTIFLEKSMIDCNNNEDCPEQTKCEGNMFLYRNGICGSDNKCSYGDWNFGNCTLSIQYCGVQCDDESDCGGIPCRPDCTCETG